VNIVQLISWYENYNIYKEFKFDIIHLFILKDEILVTKHKILITKLLIKKSILYIIMIIKRLKNKENLALRNCY